MLAMSAVEWVVLGVLVLAGAWWVLHRSVEPGLVAKKLAWSAAVVGVTAVVLVKLIGPGSGGGVNYMVAIIVACSGAACGLVLAAIWGRNIGELLARPLTSLFEGEAREADPEPLYGAAEANMKQGRWAEAEAEIRKQLALFPSDLKGTLMLGELKAGAGKDLAGALAILEEFMARPGVPTGDVTAALYRVADWQLRLAGDTEAARAALMRVLELAPNPEAAYVARQRLAHLPSAEVLEEHRSPHRIAVPKGDERLGLRPKGSVLPPPEEAAEVRASRWLRHLEVEPEDAEARERLARIYGQELGRVDLAASELERLIEGRKAPPAQVVAWLHALADMQVQCAGDVAGAGRTLMRIEEKYPRSAHAEVAMRRRMQLSLELRRRTQTEVVRMAPPLP